MSSSDVLATVYRGNQAESEHRGSVVVVDSHGSIVAHVGDPYEKVFMRSCAKPFQALPVVSSGARDRFQFTDAELALMAGSHAGEDIHVMGVKSILSKIGLTEKALLCGAHAPHSNSVLHNNCSGKHAGMLAVAVDMGLSPSDYLEQDHPVQKIIREGLLEFLGLPESDLGLAIDGCSAPTFYVPLVSMARAFARLASPLSLTASAVPSEPTMKSVVGSGCTWSRRDALAFVAQAMMKHPQMVAGTGRLDTEVMSALPGRIVMKGGAEGVQCMGVVSEVGYSGPLGIALKISDGNGRRAAGPVAIEILKQLGISLPAFENPLERNARGIVVGQIKTEFRLRT